MRYTCLAVLLLWATPAFALDGILRQSTAVDLPVGPFVDSTDGNTPETALTITQPDIRLKKNGAAWAQKNAAQTLTHEEDGYYEVSLDTTDTNTLGPLRLSVHEAGALHVWHNYLVVTPAEYDRLLVSTARISGTLAAGSTSASLTSPAFSGTDTSDYVGWTVCTAGGCSIIRAFNPTIDTVTLASPIGTVTIGDPFQAEPASLWEILNRVRAR
jgi:hypothetical protein